MAWTNYQLFLSVLLVITGSINTLNTKWADNTSSKGRDGIDHKFNHPFFQATCMFVSQIFCLLFFKIMFKVYSSRGDGSEDEKVFTRGNRNFNPFILFIPAMCDMVATSVIYIGLNLTYASSYQMLRSAAIIFVALLSVAFLKRVLKIREWFGIFVIIVGLTLVGVSDFISKGNRTETYDNNDILVGDLLIVFSQVATAIQNVVEEKFLQGLDIPPLQVTGWEGVFGFCVLTLLQIAFYHIKAGRPFSDNPYNVLEDSIDAFIQLGNNWQIALALSMTMISISFFNFAGVSVTKELSATTRMVLDNIRTVVIWIISLLFLGQKFHWLQLLGFIVFLVGLCFYNNITCEFAREKLKGCCAKCRKRDENAPEKAEGSTRA